MAAPQPLAPGTAASVSVPATSANLGPGFDSMGLALELRDEVTLTVVAGPDVAEVEGEGAATLPRDGAHLILRLAHEHLRARGVRAPIRDPMAPSAGLLSRTSAVLVQQPA